MCTVRAPQGTAAVELPMAVIQKITQQTGIGKPVLSDKGDGVSEKRFTPARKLYYI